MANLSRIIKLAVFAIVVLLVVSFADLPALFGEMSRVGPLMISIGFLLSMATIGLIALKWHLVMPEVGVLTLYRILLIGQFYSFFLLGQASGEAAKIYLLARASGKSSGATVSVLTDRLTSLIGLLVASVMGFAFSPSQYPQAARHASLILLAVLVGGLLALRQNVVFLFAERIAARIERASPRIAPLAEHFRQAIEQWHIAVHNLLRICAANLIGIAVHLGNVLLAMLLARGIGFSVSFFDWCWIVGLMSIAGLVPVTVGPVTAGGALVGLLQLLQIPLPAALALSVLLMSIHFVIALIGSLLEWRRLHGGEPLRRWS